MADKKISELNSVSLPLAGTEVIPIVQGGETKKITADDLKEVIEGYFNGTNFYTDAGFTNLITPASSKIYVALDTNLQYRWSGSAYVEIGGGGKRTQTVEFAINQNIAASTNWYSFLTFNANINTASLTATNASLTPTNDFANMGIQTPCKQVNFNCKIKNARFRAGTNSGSTDIRICIVKSFGNSVALIANPDIIADKTFNTYDPNASLCRQNFTGADLDDTVVIDAGSEIRFFLSNNNVASNLFSGILTVEFEEI